MSPVFYEFSFKTSSHSICLNNLTSSLWGIQSGLSNCRWASSRGSLFKIASEAFAWPNMYLKYLAWPYHTFCSGSQLTPWVFWSPPPCWVLDRPCASVWPWAALELSWRWILITRQIISLLTTKLLRSMRLLAGNVVWTGTPPGRRVVFSMAAGCIITIFSVS